MTLLVRQLIAAALASTPALCLAQADTAACNGSTLETRLLPRTLMFSASATSTESRLPHPLADELLQRVSNAFHMPATVSPPVLIATGRLPGDVSANPDSSWAIADISLVARLTFDKDGKNTNVAFERTYDARLDSTFEAAVAAALAESTALPVPDDRSLRADTVTFDVALGIVRLGSDSAREDHDRAIARGDRIEYAIGELRLPHLHGLTMPVLKKGFGSPQYPASLRSTRTRGRVVAEFVIDGDGQVLPQSVWLSESSAPEFSTAVLDYLLRVRPQFVPARLGACSRPVRLRKPFEFFAF